MHAEFSLNALTDELHLTRATGPGTSNRGLLFFVALAVSVAFAVWYLAVLRPSYVKKVSGSIDNHTHASPERKVLFKSQGSLEGLGAHRSPIQRPARSKHERLLLSAGRVATRETLPLAMRPRISPCRPSGSYDEDSAIVHPSTPQTGVTRNVRALQRARLSPSPRTRQSRSLDCRETMCNEGECELV